jgi:Mg/Co/Ni transporter MgtE
MTEEQLQKIADALSYGDITIAQLKEFPEDTQRAILARMDPEKQKQLTAYQSGQLEIKRTEMTNRQKIETDKIRIQDDKNNITKSLNE